MGLMAGTRWYINRKVEVRITRHELIVNDVILIVPCVGQSVCFANSLLVTWGRSFTTKWRGYT